VNVYDTVPGFAFVSAAADSLSFTLPGFDLSFTRAMIEKGLGFPMLPPFKFHWPPVLGLYCEASVCRVKVG